MIITIITFIITIIITIISITNIIITITCIYYLFVDRKEKQYAAVLEKIQPLHHQQQQQQQSGQQHRPKSANNATSSSNYSFPSSRERKKPLLTTTTTTTTTDNTTTPPSSSAKHHDKSKPRPYSARASLKPKVPKLSRNNTSDDWDSRVYNFISPYGTTNDYNSELVSNNMKPPLSIYDQRREFVTSYVKIYNEAESSRKKMMDHDNKGTYCR